MSGHMSLIHTYASHLNFVSRPLILLLRNMPAVYAQVTGEANENQVCEALRRYRDRECFIQQALVHLYNLTTDIDKPRPDVLQVLCSVWFAGISHTVTNKN